MYEAQDSHGISYVLRFMLVSLPSLSVLYSNLRHVIIERRDYFKEIIKVASIKCPNLYNMFVTVQLPVLCVFMYTKSIFLSHISAS